MARNNSRKESAKKAQEVNVVKNNQNAATMKANNAAPAQVADNKSALAGEQEKVFKTLVGNLHKLYKTRSTINGRLLDLASVAGDYRKIVESGEFKGMVKMQCDNLALVQTDGKGNAVGTYILPVKFVPLSAKESYSDYKIEDLVVKIMGRKSAKNWALAGYTHDGSTVATANFAELRHDYSHEVTRTQSAVAADGTQVTVPVYEQDENGNRKAVKDIVTETYVPVYCDTISPKAFEKAVAKAIENMWFQLFAK